MKPKIRLLDNQFSHTHPGSFGCGDLKTEPTHFSWDRTGKAINDLVVVTEGQFFTVDSINCKIKIGLILEPVSISPEPYQWIKQPSNYQKFTYILTHNKELLSVDDRFRWYPFGGAWILPTEQQIYPKTKNISIIASWKNMTEGHKLRHEVVRRFGDRIDVFGNGYTKIASVLEAYKDYKYTIVIENEKRNGWFTEKIISPMRSGCSPIYWGDPFIKEYFDETGILSFNSLDELGQIIDSLIEWHQPDSTATCLENSGTWNNFETAAQYCIPEDWLWNNFFKPLNLVQ